MGRLRAAIYARHSTAKQNPTPSDDQVAACRALVGQLDGDVVETYTDHEVSGYRRDRPGLMRMLRDLEDGRIDVIVCEALDRIARDGEDISWLGKKLSYHRVRLFTHTEREIDKMKLAVAGLLGSIFLSTWGCSTARSSGTCANTRTISTPQLEARVLGALRDRLLQPDLVAAFVEEYRREGEAHRVTAAAARAKLAAKRAKVTGRIERLTDMMADGIGDYAEMKGRLAAALAERDGMDCAAEDDEAAPAVAMHPNLAEAYRQNVARITEALNAPELEAGEARLALRNLVELITAEPRAEGRGLDLLVHGRLAQILHIANGRPDVRQGGRLRNVVAGARSGADHTSGTPEGDCMFEMVAGARSSPKQQKAPEGADCMFGLVAGTRTGRCHTSPVIDI